MLGIIILWKTTLQLLEKKHLLFIRIFLHQNSFAIIIKSFLFFFCRVINAAATHLVLMEGKYAMSDVFFLFH